MTPAQVLKALMQFAPDVIKTVREFAGVHGIDLGPAPPDIMKDAAAVDAEIDRRLREQAASSTRSAEFTLEDEDDQDDTA